MSWKFLSYPLDGNAFGYGNGDRIAVKQVRDMCCGDTSNNTEFSMPTHYGTHIDFPFHFSKNGKTSSSYSAEDFVFNQVEIIEIKHTETIEDDLIRNNNLKLDDIDKNCDFLVVKTGLCHERYSEKYWKYGYGFHEETAQYLKQHLPHIKAIGFDLISLNAYQNRPAGRIAHKAFLETQDIIIVEEMDLTKVSERTQINQLILGILPLANSDGAPCSILADISQ